MTRKRQLRTEEELMMTEMDSDATPEKELRTTVVD